MDRSISPSSSTKTSAMPSATSQPAWVIRLTRLAADRNWPLRIWKYATMTPRPMTTGSAPLFPPRTRVHQIFAYSPSESAMTSGAAAPATPNADALDSTASDGGSWTSVLTGTPVLNARLARFRLARYRLALLRPERPRLARGRGVSTFLWSSARSLARWQTVLLGLRPA